MKPCIIQSNFIVNLTRTITDRWLWVKIMLNFV